MKPILLASQSPRRRQILSYFGLPFSTTTPPYEEPSYDGSLSPKEYVIALAQGKAASIQKNDHIIITADTIVVCDEKVFGKPKDRQEAASMLQQLSGRSHQVMSALCVDAGDGIHSGVEIADVRFHSLSTTQINLYLDQIHWQDKAGAYSVQEAGSIIIEGINGCFHGVMGLPISLLERLLQEVGVQLWEHLYEN